MGKSFGVILVFKCPNEAAGHFKSACWSIMISLSKELTDVFVIKGTVMSMI